MGKNKTDDYTEEDYDRLYLKMEERRAASGKSEEKITREDLDEVVSEYHEPERLAPDLTPVKKTDQNWGGMVAGAIIGLGVLAGVVTFLPQARDYVKAIRGYFSTHSTTSQYIPPRQQKTLESSVQNSVQSQNNSPAASPQPVQRNSYDYSDTIDMMISQTEIVPGLTIENILGKSMSEFYATTDPNDVVDEITRDTMRAVARRGLQMTDQMVRGVIKGASDYVENSSEAQKFIQGASDYMNRPETQEAVSQMKEEASKVAEGINNYMNRPETQEVVSQLKNEVSRLQDNLKGFFHK